MTEPLVSCVCVTYGRPTLLGEAVKCFIDQDYPNKEMIIVNDQEGVTLKLDKPQENIIIHNCSKRFKSLGEKRNHAMSLAMGDYICIWDDDDLYTPWRITDSVEYMKSNKSLDIIKGQMALMSVHDTNYKIVNNLFHSQAIITKEYVNKTTYLDISVGEDAAYERNARIGSFPIDPLYWYVYRWGLNIHHLSGITDDKRSWARSLEFEPYTKLNGEIEIKPEFQQDHWENIIKCFEAKRPNYASEWENKLSEKK